ncbi:MAG: D-2-hydroxyacid dehydrogenase [Chloroflexota bacterium]
MPKLVMLPPHKETVTQWAQIIADEIPAYQVVIAEDEDDVRRHIVDADAVFGWISPELLPLAEKLRWLQSPQAGPPKGFYYPELVTHPVTICNPRGVYNDHIAQHILMFVLALARGLPYYMDAQRASRWDKDARKSQYIDLTTATALIVGVGGIGHETAKLCHACGMRVLGTDSRWEYPVAHVEKHSPDELDSLLPQADFVLVTVPHTPDTEGMWNADRFKLMKETGYFINIGRGATTKLDDLVAALETGEIAGCALDVYETEPLPSEHKLWTLPNVILTPHIAVHEAENIPDRWFELFLDNARRFAAGEELRNVVDKTMWY